MNNSWLKYLQNAKKTLIVHPDRRKIHYLLEDGKEMVEEYNIVTNVLTRRTWKKKGDFGQDAGWEVELGDPEPKLSNDLEFSGIEENSSCPIISKRMTKISIEWRIRNLPYPADTYSVTVESDGTITVRTTNKKYFKRIQIPDLERCGLKPVQDRISFTHRHNTLIITYKKPPALLEMEKEILQEVLKLEAKKDGEVQCPTS